MILENFLKDKETVTQNVCVGTMTPGWPLEWSWALDAAKKASQFCPDVCFENEFALVRLTSGG